MKGSGKNISLNDCRGCAAKIPQIVLNKSLINSNLDSFASSPEDSVEIYQNGKDIILQSVDGFPALVSDCLLYTSPSPRDNKASRMPSSA